MSFSTNFDFCQVFEKKRDQRELIKVGQRNFRKYMAMREWGWFVIIQKTRYLSFFFGIIIIIITRPGSFYLFVLQLLLILCVQATYWTSRPE